MAASITFDQVGISAGNPGESRMDGIPGAKVTITNASALACTCKFVDMPIEDDSAVLVQESPSVWSFTPKSGVYNEYLVEMYESSTNTRDVKAFGIAMPNSGLVVPAHQARGVRTVNLSSTTGEKNAAALVSTHNTPLGGRNYLGWWPHLRNLFYKVEELAGASPGTSSGSAFKEVIWRPAYAGSNPLIHATFDAALAEALTSPGIAVIVMDASLSSTFAMPNVASDGESRVLLEAPRVQTGTYTISFGTNDECKDFLGLVVRPGVSVVLSASAGGPNGTFFNLSNEKINFLIQGNITTTGAGARTILTDKSTALSSVQRQIVIRDRSSALAASSISMAGNTHVLVTGPRTITSAGAAIVAASGTPTLSLEFTEGAGLPPSAYSGWSGSVSVTTFPSAEFVSSAQSSSDWYEGTPSTVKNALEALAARDLTSTTFNAALTFDRNKAHLLASGTGDVEFTLAGSGHSLATCTDIVVWVKANSGVTSLSVNAAFNQQGNPFVNFDPTKGYQAFFSRLNFGGSDVTYAITGKVVGA